MNRTMAILAFLALALVPLPATAVAGHPPHRVTVDMLDFKFKLSKAAVPRGTAVFKVANKGEVVHDFKIAGKKTPIFVTGRAGTLRVTLAKPGRYRYICTVPGHVSAGMWGVLRVR